MRTIEERVAFLEGRLSQARLLTHVRSAPPRLDQAMNGGFDAIQRRPVTLEGRMGAPLTKTTVPRAGSDSTSMRLRSLDRKLSHQFAWLMGLQVATLVVAVTWAVTSFR